MAVHPSVPAKTVPEFIAYAKANPGKINVASPGTGTSTHLAGELFKLMTGVDIVQIQYRGNGPGLIDLLAGQVQVTFDTMPSTIEYIRTGRLRALAVCTVTRSHALPDLPTVAEFVPGYESSGYFGFGAPAKTPAESPVMRSTLPLMLLLLPRLDSEPPKATITSFTTVILTGDPTSQGGQSHELYFS
jgi:tripartite-type tricarboxylate transporter receptor subunit TctC